MSAESRRWTVPVVVVAVLAITLFLGLELRSLDSLQRTDSASCSGCHQLDQPGEDLALSGHEDLVCADCHVPSLADRGRHVLAALTGDVLATEENEHVEATRCAGCHVEGTDDPEAYIGDLAVHRVHLESARFELGDLPCTACHVPDVHALDPSDEGCQAAGCHEDAQIVLGQMAHEEVACSDCHGTGRPLPPAAPEYLGELLTPAATQCLGCHEMTEVTDIPEHDPHIGQCASCHLPHEHTVVADAQETCANAGCHDDAAELSGAHTGLTPGALADCASCHEAHEFVASQRDCRSCHEDLFTHTGAASTGSGNAPLGVVGVGVPPSVPLDVLARMAHAGGPVSVEDPFDHVEHEAVECTECHSAEADDPHGRLTVVTAADCRSCHHSERAGVECAACHEGYETAPEESLHAVAFALTVWDDVRSRDLVFTHGQHASEDCSTCHTEGLRLDAPDQSCADCHEQHHTVEVTCAACHTVAPEEEHPAQVHVGCAGAACHTSNPLGVAPRDDAVCMGCHQDLEVDHKPGKECVACHLMPHPDTPWIGNGFGVGGGR